VAGAGMERHYPTGLYPLPSTRGYNRTGPGRMQLRILTGAATTPTAVGRLAWLHSRNGTTWL
jgi:hypothetical protein